MNRGHFALPTSVTFPRRCQDVSQSIPIKITQISAHVFILLFNKPKKNSLCILGQFAESHIVWIHASCFLIMCSKVSASCFKVSLGRKLCSQVLGFVCSSENLQNKDETVSECPPDMSSEMSPCPSLTPSMDLYSKVSQSLMWLLGPAHLLSQRHCLPLQPVHTTPETFGNVAPPVSPWKLSRCVVRDSELWRWWSSPTGFLSGMCISGGSRMDHVFYLLLSWEKLTCS